MGDRVTCWARRQGEADWEGQGHTENGGCETRASRWAARKNKGRRVVLIWKVKCYHDFVLHAPGVGVGFTDTACRKL